MARGTIEQRGNDRWRLSVQVGGRRMRRTVTAKNRAAAKRALATWLDELAVMRGDGWGVTVGDLLERHLAEQDYAATSHDDYRRIVARLPDDLKDAALHDVRPAMVDGWYRQLADAGWSAHRVNKLHDLLGPAFERAVRWEWVVRNPVRHARPPAVKQGERTVPTADVVSFLVALAPGDFAAWVHLAAHLGARRGEVCGLRWEDVDLDAGRVLVRRSVAYTPSTGVIVKETKTGRGRVVAIGSDTVDVLRRHRDWQESELAKVAASLTPAMYLFSTHATFGEPMRPDAATRRFLRLCEKAGVSGVRLHDLRHAAATHMLDAGVPPHTVAERLGHRSVQMTLDRYGHAVPARDREAADALERLYR